jgi:hypothetical protein
MTIRSLFAAAAFAAALPAAAAPSVSREDFSNPASGWPNMAATRASDLGFAVYTDSGKYQLTPVQDGVFGFVPAPRQATGGDVRIEADLFLYAGVGAGAAGLGCRHTDHRNFYAFMARGDAVLMIVKVKDGEPTVLAQGRVKSVMPGSVDTRMTATCHGDALELRASGGATLTARDGDLREGAAGVFVVGEKLAGTSATFDDWALADLAAR